MIGLSPLPVNAPFLDALELAALWLSAGIAWSWIVPVPASLEFWRRRWISLAVALSLGATSSVLTCAALAEYGGLSLSRVWVVQLVLAAVGLCLAARMRAWTAVRDHLRAVATVGLPFVVLLGFLLSRPRAGEWIVGGWDPGIYVGQGMDVARTGSFHAPPQPVYAAMNERELDLLTRNRPGYYEIFAGVPIDPQTRALQPYFFRLFPAWIALLALQDGAGLAVRANLPAGLLALVLFVALLAAWRLRPAHVALSAVLLAAHPLWLFALRLPTTEVLHAALLFALFLVATVRRAGPTTPPAFALLALASVINRFDAILQGAALLAALAWLDAARPDRRRVLLEHGALAAGLWVGAGLDFLWCQVTLDKISEVVLPLTYASGLVTLLALAWDALAPRLTRLHDFLHRALTPVLTFGALAAVVLLGWAPLPALRESSALFRAFLFYLGPALSLLAAVGALLFFFRMPADRDARALLLVALALSAALFVHSHIVPIFPWAMRRFVSIGLPALAVLAAAVPARWFERGGLRAGVGGALACALVLAPGRAAWAAWRTTEYDGAHAALAAVASQIPDDAVVIADHQWWGTPLLHLYGRSVINGSRLWQPASADERAAAWQAVSRLRDEGFHFVFLTSTTNGMAVFPEPAPDARLVWSGPALQLRELMHHRRPIGFVARERALEFRLYDWHSVSSPADE